MLVGFRGRTVAILALRTGMFRFLVPALKFEVCQQRLTCGIYSDQYRSSNALRIVTGEIREKGDFCWEL